MQRLIIELAVHVLAKQGLANGGQSINLQQPQTLLKGIVDFNLTTAADNRHATSSKRILAISIHKCQNHLRSVWQVILFIDVYRHVSADLGFEFLLRIADCFLDGIGILLTAPNNDLVFIQIVETLED